MRNNGLFITLEGSDGSGKGTQFAKLVQRLRKEGHSVATFDFPQYGKPSAHFVEAYLRGDYGSAEEVGPYVGSLFYSLDRYEAAKSIREALNQGKIVISNRFTASNMAHQGTKFSSEDERKAYFAWIEGLEYNTLGIPRPDLNLVLVVPAIIAQSLLEKRGVRDDTGTEKDIHEADINHLEKAVAAYEDLCTLKPKEFTKIDCTRDERMRSIDEVAKLIWDEVAPKIPDPPGKADPPTSAHGAAAEDRGGESRAMHLSDNTPHQKFTNVDSNVYAFTATKPSVNIAKLLTQSNARPTNLRALTEITAPTSASAFARIPLAIDNGSQLLASILQNVEGITVFEQFPHISYFDQKDKRGNYTYYTPRNLDAATARTYESTIDQLFGLYAGMMRKLIAHLRASSKLDAQYKLNTRQQASLILRPILPVATTSLLGIEASVDDYKSIIATLNSHELGEAQQAGRQIHAECKKIDKLLFSEDAAGNAITDAQRATTRQMQATADELLPQMLSADTTTGAQLINVRPRNELGLVPHMLYGHTNLSFEQLEKEVANWNYEQKMHAFDSYLNDTIPNQCTGRALEQAQYTWDVIADYHVLRELQNQIGETTRITNQELTPRYGYEVPKVLETAGLSETFEKCFDLSYQLYSTMQQAGFYHEAQYATLLGHRTRFTLHACVRDVLRIHREPINYRLHPDFSKCLAGLQSSIGEVHPSLQVLFEQKNI